MGANGQIGVGVVGLGDGGMSNIRSLNQIPGVRIVAICDREPAKNFAAGTELSGSGDFTSYLTVERLLEDPGVDLVVVATPDDQHLAPVRAALEAGKHVFLEKPVATTLDDLAAFGDLMRQHPGKLWFGEKYSYAYPVQAALRYRGELGEFLTGSTMYTMWRCDRIMGGGKWRTEMAYNPVAGGLSHNFMTALLFVGAPIAKVCARGHVFTYHENLDRHGGYDTMEGVLEFANGRCLTWLVCLAVQDENSPFAHRTVTHTFQFQHGSLVYGPEVEQDLLLVAEKEASFVPEPSADTPGTLAKRWGEYNIRVLYGSMWANIIAAIGDGAKPLHTLEEGINVAAACTFAFESAKEGGRWLEVPF